MVDFEKGSAAWDIGMILTRHKKFGQGTCMKVHELRRTTALHGNFTAEDRLDRALSTACTCSAGDSDSERTSKVAKAKTQ